MTTAIIVRQHPEEATRTPENSCYWIAEVTVDGQVFTAHSRHGAPYELARLLVVAGIPDAPLEITTEGLRGSTLLPSFHKAATRTISEGKTSPVRTVPYVSFEDRQRGVGEAETEGVIADCAMTAPLTRQPINQPYTGLPDHV